MSYNTGNQTTEQIAYLVVMLVKAHLEIHSYELTQMTVSVGVFCTEHCEGGEGGEGGEGLKHFEMGVIMFVTSRALK